MLGSVGRRGEARGAMSRFSAEEIISAGLQVASKPGATTITVREVGQIIDADPTAIYRHFGSKAGLMQALQDRVLELCLSRVTAPREQWRTRLLQLAEATIDLFVEYRPIGVDAIALSTEGQAELKVLELVLDALRVSGLRDSEVVHHYSILSSYMLSYASGIARVPTLSVGEPETRGWLVRTLPVTPETFPNISALRGQLLALRDRDIYFAGVNDLLDAVEAAAAKNTQVSAHE